MTSDVVTSETGTRLPGRPRSAVADQAILDAAVGLYAEHGYEGLSVEGVAEQAGVGKATIYRRYPTKADLVLAAVACVMQDDDVYPDTGSLRGDVTAIVEKLTRKLTSDVGRMLPQFIADMSRHPDLAEAHHAFVSEKRAISKAAFRRAVERGEMDPEVDVELAADLLAGPLFYRRLLSGAPLSKRYVGSVVDAVCRSVSP